ncbi:NAD-binding protein [Kitasatospora sp. NPDC059673]|uniref:NAD-binding protein n=1 Tax=Kitasatospora sp. NPDC059673 TaxID=3346901 RepID=UPI0036A4D241
MPRTATARSRCPVPAPPGAPSQSGGHMVVCGGDALTHRLAVELADRYGQHVVLLVPLLQHCHGPRIAALAADPQRTAEVTEAGQADERALAAAGVEHAAALALTSDDNQANLHAARAPARLNPDLRLVVRVFNRRLGQRVEQLLDRAVLAVTPGCPPPPWTRPPLCCPPPPPCT